MAHVGHDGFSDFQGFFGFGSLQAQLSLQCFLFSDVKNDHDHATSCTAVIKYGGDTAQGPKFFFAVNTEKIQDASNVLLSGISTQNSPISLNMQLNEATTTGYNIILMCMYDVLIEIDTIMKQASVKQ